MDIDALLARDGLAPEVRLLVGAAGAVWRADWRQLTAWSTRARALGHPRTELEEALLMCALFCGFPRAITAWGHLDAAWPAATGPAGGGLPAAERQPAGDALFAAVYGDNEAQVRATLRAHHQELHDFVLEAAYARILTRPGLPALTRELIAVGVLAVEEQERQFRGHARGARNLGATEQQLAEVLQTVFADEPDRVLEWSACARVRDGA
jgi:alkylhydroperoxidase/carboxymuconolactone decarboxylase family protein YurZ